jgi:hypothetical protein
MAYLVSPVEPRIFGRIRSLEALIARCSRLGDTRTTLHDVEAEVAWEDGMSDDSTSHATQFSTGANKPDPVFPYGLQTTRAGTRS